MLFRSIKANQPQYMNSYDGSGSTNLQINLGVKFSNNDKVTLQIDTAAIATLGDLSNLRNETQAKLDKETTRATEKEKNLALDIETEKNRAIKAENTLQTNIDTIDSRAQSEEKKLSNKLDTETTRAIQSEQELQEKVETEKNRAQSKEDELKSLINSNKQTLNEPVLNEQNRAMQAEENLQSKITSEQNRAMTKENTLDSKIVQAKRTANDSITKVNSVNDEVTTARGRFSNLNDRLNNQDIKINSAETVTNTKLSNMSEAVSSLRVISKTVSVDQINAKSNLTVTVDVGFETGYTSQLANLSVLVCSNSNVSVINFWYDGLSSKLYVVVENPTTNVITNMILFCKIPTFKKSNLI